MNIPQEWTRLLARIRTFAPTAILCGGALRDLDNDRPVKDLDVFVNAVEQDLIDELEKTHHFSATCPGGYVDAAKEVQSTYRFIAKCEGCDTWCTCAPKPELNLIQLASDFNPEKIVNRVDFGLCQIASNGEWVFHTDAYERDREKKTFTLTRAETPEGVKRSLKRYERLSMKYPGWGMVVPKEFSQIVVDVMSAPGGPCASGAWFEISV